MYTLTNIGGVGGSRSEGFAVSVHGAVAGTALDVQERSRGFSYEGFTQYFEAETDARGINADGAVIGTSGGYATVWKGGSAESLGTLGGTSSEGLAINDLGYSTGGADRSDGKRHAFLYANGHMIDLGTLGGSQSDGYALNNSGQVVGTSDTARNQRHAFIWDRKNGMRDLGTLGGSDSHAKAINSQGAVAGVAMTRSRYFHATVWDTDGAVIDLGTLGGQHSFAYGLNDSGVVVGFSYDTLGRSRAFVWSNGMLFDLNDLVSNSAGWSLTAAYGINASGQIVGTGYFNGQSSAFLLDPVMLTGRGRAEDVMQGDLSAVPEPGSLSVVGLGVILAWRWRVSAANALHKRSQ